MGYSKKATEYKSYIAVCPLCINWQLFSHKNFKVIDNIREMYVLTVACSERNAAFKDI